MTEGQIAYMTERFLCYELPKDFNPDGGVSFEPPPSAAQTGLMPYGTNILTATQALEMVRFMVEGMPE